ncbi:MAG: rRNA maturation RNase YbeY [Deltaproteobacteria bacterium]|nr:rRNA maturation RNase YbeY [Deltaproteobacteria bacterium]
MREIEKTPNILNPAEFNVDVLGPSSTEFIVKCENISALAHSICKKLGVQGFELCIKFVDATEIAKLNKLYRNINRPTDVLSFPQEEWDEPLTLEAPRRDEIGPTGPLGDLAICLDLAQENAQKIGHGLDREVCFLIVHGVLHLCGHDHIEKEEEALMLSQQKKLMAFLANGPSPTPMWLDCVRKFV